MHRDNERRKLPDRRTMREQLETIKHLESLIAQKRINESYDRIMQEADKEFDIHEATRDGGQ